ncbi:MAG: hypothetical protein AAB432_02870 [Patescibacteria group bacterium]
MQNRFIVVFCLFFAGLGFVKAQDRGNSDSTYEAKGGYVEGHFYAKPFAERHITYLVAYMQSFTLYNSSEDEERMGWFVFARANPRPKPGSAIIFGLSYSPIPYFGLEAGAGVTGNSQFDGDWSRIRSRVWFGDDLNSLSGQKNLYYFDFAFEFGDHRYSHWESRLKIRATEWLGIGIYGEDSIGIGPRIDIQPKSTSISFSIMGLWEKLNINEDQNYYYDPAMNSYLLDETPAKKYIYVGFLIRYVL